MPPEATAAPQQPARDYKRELIDHMEKGALPDLDLQVFDGTLLRLSAIQQCAARDGDESLEILAASLIRRMNDVASDYRDLRYSIGSRINAVRAAKP